MDNSGSRCMPRIIGRCFRGLAIVVDFKKPGQYAGLDPSLTTVYILT
ncbi:MAG: hypothetical protein ACI9OI_001730 [Chitinophagales bacterium]|jgi:hypothetical protein